MKDTPYSFRAGTILTQASCPTPSFTVALAGSMGWILGRSTSIPMAAL